MQCNSATAICITLTNWSCECGFPSLPPPPKVKEVMFSLLSVCFFVCVQDISKSCGRIRTNFCGQVRCVIRTNWLSFGEDPHPDPTIWIFKVILHHWERGQNRCIARYLNKVVDAFGWNLVDTLGVWQGRIDSILMKIRIQILIIF